MDSIYFPEPNGLLIELASYRFEPPHGFTHADVLLEAHKLRVERGDYNIDRVHLADAIEKLSATARVALLDRSPKNPTRTEPCRTLNILKPSVNNLTVRIFVRAAGLDFEEVDVWGKTGEPEFLAKDPADLTPMLEEGGLPRGSLWESCAIMQYLCNKHGLDAILPEDPGERAMMDSAMFYLIGTLYPLLAGPRTRRSASRSTPARTRRPTRPAGRREAALAEPLEVFRAFFLDGALHRRRRAVDRRHAPGRVLEFLRAIDYALPGLARRVHGRGWRRRSATRTRSRPPTCAATSPT